MIKLTKGKVTAIICGVFAIVVLCLMGSIGEDVKNERIALLGRFAKAYFG